MLKNIDIMTRNEKALYAVYTDIVEKNKDKEFRFERIVNSLCMALIKMDENNLRGAESTIEKALNTIKGLNG